MTCVFLVTCVINLPRLVKKKMDINNEKHNISYNIFKLIQNIYA